MIPNPSLKNWKPYLGKCDDKFADEFIDVRLESREEVLREAVFLSGGKSSEKIVFGEGALSPSDDHNLEILSDKQSFRRSHASDLAAKFLSENQDTLLKVTEALVDNLVFSEQEIAELLAS